MSTPSAWARKAPIASARAVAQRSSNTPPSSCASASTEIRRPLVSLRRATGWFRWGRTGLQLAASDCMRTRPRRSCICRRTSLAVPGWIPVRLRPFDASPTHRVRWNTTHASPPFSPRTRPTRGSCS
ncbi:hypothetical protein G9Q37_00760 [Hydrogenophaga crocea]|uniref:Uncharacterized protein n=1 Tax=Hydrogenophaga crocea TaxID=2716225 RepID=A0A6G8ICA1_9BURK|nr:hypothetical protein G9Q37_00760 [Hydrogenophaga crocea]